jgi:hypothetical protein
MRLLSVLFAVLFFTFTFLTVTQAACSQDQINAGECLKLDNPLKSKNIDSPQALIGQIINSLFGIIGSLALVMFVYGGLLWMTSAGSAEQVKKGKDIFIWAAVGLVVVFSAYSLVRFVITGVGG